jgi:YD repeat-containing protein
LQFQSLPIILKKERETVAEINTEYRYDALNRLVEIISCKGPLQVICYDAAGNRVYQGPAPAGHAALPEPFRALHRQYLFIRARFDCGGISGEAFTEEINRLRLQDAAGSWWQISEADGSWLKWDGAAWVEEKPY